MDVAGQLVVMNDGRVEQTGGPADLYEHPANEFVMSFVGEVNRIGEHFVRPHDMEMLGQPDQGTEPARVERVVRLGFEVRVELAMSGDREIWAQVTREEAERLDLEEGRTVHVRPRRAKKFEEGTNGGDPATAEQPAHA
jgi:sulfate transport system ATP-binding protein